MLFVEERSACELGVSVDESEWQNSTVATSCGPKSPFIYAVLSLGAFPPSTTGGA